MWPSTVFSAYPKKRALRNPDVKAEYDALHDELDLIDRLLTARSQEGLNRRR